MQFLVNSLTLQVLNTHRAEAEAGGKERNKASLQFCLPHFTISTENCSSSTPCCPQQFYIWFWFNTSLHYSAWISVLLHVVGLVLQDQSQGRFLGGFICFHLRQSIWRSGIFTQVLCVGTVRKIHVGFPLHSGLELSYSEHWKLWLLLCQGWKAPHGLERSHLTFGFSHLSHVLSVKQWQGMPSSSRTKMRVRPTSEFVSLCLLLEIKSKLIIAWTLPNSLTFRSTVVTPWKSSIAH